MYSDDDTHRWVGCPIRISTDQSLLAAPHGFSQRATSFIASWCQGIHRMPFSCSNPMHRNHPHSRTDDPAHAGHLLNTQHTHIPERCPATTLAASLSASARVRQTTRLLDGHSPGAGPDAAHRATPTHPSRPAHPGMHQNLIHLNKDHRNARPRRRTARPPPNASRTRPASRSPRAAQPRRPHKETHHQRNRQPPTARRLHPALETDGFEPTTPCLQSRCSPN